MGVTTFYIYPSYAIRIDAGIRLYFLVKSLRPYRFLIEMPLNLHKAMPILRLSNHDIDSIIYVVFFTILWMDITLYKTTYYILISNLVV